MYPKRIILFDTETTGTNVFEDDIVQIAAFKIFQGKITDKCNIFLETEKEIPTMLGNIKNPLLDTYNDPKTKKFQRNEGLQAFLDFLKDSDSIIAHNIQFDYYILDNNIQRDLKIPSFKNDHPIYFDTLKISKLLYPKLPSYKLKALISHLHLEGNNSHMADDDVFATKSLLDACFNKAKEILPKQKNFLASNTDALNKIRKLYLEPYRHTQENLYRKTDRILLVDEIKWLYKYFTENEIIKKPKNTNFDDKIDSVFLLFEKIMAEDLGKYLIEQISNHILKLTTFKEADIYENDIIDKKIFISTVHKAKGLEFENVIVTDVVDGWYPFFSSNTKDKKAEDKRKFYVAISRAQKRLALLTYKYYHSISKNTSKENLECSWQYPKTQSEFLTTILELFNNTQEKES